MIPGGMARFVALANAASLAAGASVLAVVPFHSRAAGAATPLPANVVVVMTDDQTVEQMRFLPKTRRLIGSRGVTFENAFVSFPLCCPSRATFFTGQYAHNHGVFTNDPERAYAEMRGRELLPRRLQESGYETIHVGKYFNGYGLEDPGEIPAGWSRWAGLAEPGIYALQGYTLSRNGTVSTRGELDTNDPRHYQTDVLATIARDEIERAPEPFFLNVAFLAPHRENLAETRLEAESDPRPAPRHANMYRSLRAPRTRSFNEADVTDKPSRVRDVRSLAPERIAEFDARYRARARSLAAVDEAVDGIFRSLARKGVLDRTYVVFTSDNGYLLGEHRVWGKYVPYEESIRVPLLVRGPGVPEGQTSQQLVSNVDLAPTLLAMAGVSVDPARMDGRSLLPFVRQPGRVDPRILLLEAAPSPARSARLVPDDWVDEAESTALPYQGIRTDRYKYVEYTNGEMELYDLFADPFEERSLHDELAGLRVLPMLQAALELLRSCAGEACRRAEDRTLFASLN